MAKVKEELEEAQFWKRERNGIRDFVSARLDFIPKGKTDFSLTRENRDNKLFALNFGRVVALNVEKIEKSHLFHFYPNSNSLIVGLPGCNFKSPFCSEFELSHKILHENPLSAKYRYYTPEQVVAIAEKKNCKSITFNYTEPMVWFEFAFKTARYAHRSNVRTAMVTNGYTTEEPIKKLGKFLDAVVVKIFGSGNAELYENYMSVKDVKPIYDTLRQLHKQKIFIEITNLIIPQIGDNLEECRTLADWISHELGAEIPLHLLQFQGGGLDIPPTPVSTLERFAEESRKEGLRYVYIHSTPPHQDESTFCHNCRELVVERKNSIVKQSRLVDNKCPKCGFTLNFVSR
ncbi:MAG: radical SAM protein [Candidatus Aenigmatarchaeota archaeon]|nr:radical SAM protein [Candidatus Aenigmarchaeota archaeon]